MSTPASKPEFSKGVVEPVGDCGMFEAAIDHLTTDNNVMTPHGPDTDASKPPSDWGGRIVMYGKTAEQAEALRERILVALELCRGAEMEWLRGFNSNPHRLPVDQHIERAMGHAGAAEVELVRQVTDGGRNPRYEGLFEGETEEQRASRLAPATEQPAKLCMGCVEQSSRIRELEHKMDYYRAASPAAGTETLPFWEPCNPGCDPEFNGQRSKWCAQLCQPAREALSVSAGGVDERAAFEAWYLGHFYMGDKQCGLEWLSTEPCGGYRHQHPAEQWIVWQARAALSANHSEQAREIERIDAGAKKIATYAVSLEQELAALKAKPSGVVRWPEADEIMQMAFEEGQPSEDASGYYFELEEFDLFIQRLMEEVARLSQAASAGDEANRYWFIGDVGQEAGQRHCKKSMHDGSLALFESETEIYMVEYYRKPQALSALSANHSEQVREWVPVSERLPETKDGTEADFIVAIRRARNGKTYVVPASFLNRFELYSEDEAADDEGCIYVTGWYRKMADDEYDTAWYKMETEGDVITHWQELPAAPSAGSQGGDV